MKFVAKMRSKRKHLWAVEPGHSSDRWYRCANCKTLRRERIPKGSGFSYYAGTGERRGSFIDTKPPECKVLP